MLISVLKSSLANDEHCDIKSDSKEETDESYTFIALKPDAVERGFVGELISRFERKGFRLVEMSLRRPDKELLEEHYEEHRGKPFFDSLIAYMSEGPVIATIWEGENVIQSARNMLGATNPLKAAPGTIRGDLATSTERNLVHASDSSESAKREIRLWFPNSAYDNVRDCWV